MTRSAVLFTFLAISGIARAGDTQTFKVGDYVDALVGGWTQCTITKPLQANAYGVSCGAADYIVTPPRVRAREATAEDKTAEAETAKALLHQPPPGDSPGGMYGTREPTKCDNRTKPSHGGPSADLARQYVICESESVYGSSLFLVTGVKVQVAAISHPAKSFVKEMKAADIDPREPVRDIRGTLTQYQCGKVSPALNPFARTHNCVVRDIPAATGYCYKNTFGDWHCAMIGAAAGTRQHVLPPDGN